MIGVGLEYLLRVPLVDLLPNPLPGYGYKPAIVALASSVLIAVPALGIPLGHLLNVNAVSVLQAAQNKIATTGMWR